MINNDPPTRPANKQEMKESFLVSENKAHS